MELAKKLKPFAVDAIKTGDTDNVAEYDLTEQNTKKNIDQQDADEKIKEILDDFKKRGWLSDARFTEQLVHARQTKFGSSRVANELREKGISEDLIADALITVKANEAQYAHEVWQKKYDAHPVSREDWARQARFLQSRGFGFDVIKKVLSPKNNDQNNY